MQCRTNWKKCFSEITHVSKPLFWDERKKTIYGIWARVLAGTIDRSRVLRFAGTMGERPDRSRQISWAVLQKNKFLKGKLIVSNNVLMKRVHITLV